jgi:hypothetical protein
LAIQPKGGQMQGFREKKHKRELKVVFDTNALYTQSASDLLNYDLAEVIRQNSSHPDLTISWYLPDIVLHERQFQMLRRADDLLANIEKLEKLLGHNLGITRKLIGNRIDETIKNQLMEFSLQRITLVTDTVDWNRLILDSAYRKPPFDPGDKEKGFRDAIILETFMQIVNNSPVTPNRCRIALVTNDSLLSDALQSRTAQLPNIRIMDNIEELKNLINTLVSEVTEEYVKVVQSLATQYFFSTGRNDTLYYKESIHQRISNDFQKELLSTAPGTEFRENGTWYISAPRFSKKQAQKIFWVSRITVEAKAYKTVTTAQNTLIPTLTRGSALSPPISPLSWTNLKPPEGSIKSIYAAAVPSFSNATFSSQDFAVPSFFSEKTLVATGKSIFEVNWSVSVSTKKKFSNPRIEGIDFIESIWDNPSNM